MTPEDEYVFLEVNEQGQFLWVEEVLPQTHYLDVFCHFLMNKKYHFHWMPHNQRVFVADFLDEANSIRNENIRNHISLNELKRSA